MPHNFFTELKRRSVFKVASIYAVTAWLIIQVVATTFPMFDFPDWSQRLVVILALIGFPIALVLAWAYDIVPDRKIDEGQEETVEEKRKKISWLPYTVGATLVVIGGVLWFTRANASAGPDLLPESVREARIAVLPYENRTNDESLDMLGSMASDWIIQSMMNLEGLKVVSYQTVKEHLSQFSSPERTGPSFEELTGAEKIIRGSFYQDRGQLIFQSQLIDPQTGEVEFAFPEIAGETSNTRAVVKELGERIVSYFVLKKEELRFGAFVLNPPKYEAFLAFENGIEVFGADYPQAISYFNEAIELDSNFFPSYGYLLTSYTNRNLYVEGDSILQLVERRFQNLRPVEQMYYEWMKSVVDRDEERQYKSILKLFEKDPKNYVINYLTGIGAGAVNRPAKAVEHFSKLGIESYDEATIRAIIKGPGEIWWYSEYAQNLILVGQPDKALEIINKIPKDIAPDWHSIVKLEAFMIKGRQDSIFQLIQSLEEKGASQNLINSLHNEAIKYYALQKDKINQMKWVDLAIERMANLPESVDLDKQNLYLAYFYSGQYEKALPLLNDVINTQGPWVIRLMRKGICLTKLGKREEAYQLIETIRETETGNLNDDGEFQYAIAGIFAALGEKEKAVEALKKAYKKGYSFSINRYKYAFEFIPLHGYEPFEAFVKPKE